MGIADRPLNRHHGAASGMGNYTLQEDLQFAKCTIIMSGDRHR
jgi:hypothetical protein